ncbi:Anamorsin [Halocaridina rubra]|uniref:Anamorsin homolog n=1 Tax=Halocaridina rubra TaxID=373956 RepID=A0AAN8XQE7_HALRR
MLTDFAIKMFGVRPSQKVLVIWNSPVDAEELQALVVDLKSTVGNDGKIALENSEMVISSGHPSSTFDQILVGVLPPFEFRCPLNVWGEALRVLKPGGTLIARTIDSSSTQSELKLSGFTSVSEPKDASLTDEQKRNVVSRVVEITCQKPNFEVGSAMKLSLGKALAPKTSETGTWKIDLDDDDVDLEDPDDLLTEEDLIRPDPASLKVCGTTGQRKACKNCVCGLKEELEADDIKKVEENKKNFKSSCGSCYLGDAFRCASCPYLGMPAFKPGEKVKLAETTLQDAA